MTVIDADSGTLHLDNGIAFASGDPIESVLAIDAPQPLEVRDMGNGWVWVTARNLQADQLYFIVSIAFFDDVLRHASLMVQRDKFGTPTWDDWSREHDREALAFMESWLTSELGDRRDFAFGRVGASIDPKTGQGASISIHYT